MVENKDLVSEAIEVMREAWCESFNACSLGQFDHEQFKKAFQLNGLKVREEPSKLNTPGFKSYFCELELSDGFFISQFLLTSLPKKHILVTEPKMIIGGETIFTALFEINGKFVSLAVSITNMTLN